MDIQSLCPKFKEALMTTGLEILCEETEAKILSFEISKNVFEARLGLLHALDLLLEKTVEMSRDQLRQFIDLIDRYNEKKNACESGIESALVSRESVSERGESRSESESGLGSVAGRRESFAASIRTESLAEPMAIDSAEASASSESSAISRETVIAEMPQLGEILCFQVYKIATLRFNKWLTQREGMQEHLGLVAKEYFEGDLSNETKILDETKREVEEQAVVTQLKKYLKYLTETEVKNTADLENFLKVVEKRARDDKNNKPYISKASSKSSLTQKKEAIYRKVRAVVMDLMEFTEVVKERRDLQNTIKELPLNEVAMSDCKDLTIRLNDFMLEALDLNLNFIQSTLEEKFKDTYYKLDQLEAKKDGTTKFHYDPATDTFLFAKCMELSFVLKSSDYELTETNKDHVARAAMEIIDVMKRPQTDFVEIDRIPLIKKVFIKVRPLERQCVKGPFPILQATASFETLAGTDEIKDE